MTPNQRQLLGEACESGDDVRIVTVVLQIAATLAREKRVAEAVKIRESVRKTLRDNSRLIDESLKLLDGVKP